MSITLNTKSIYEIFRACRLCGAGGGYKMPIIPSVVGIDCPDLELRQKIRECVQLEVSEDDRMPPLICELCLDKVNDFYAFLEMCRQTNSRTRQRLGLPQHTQSLVRQKSESEDCILGVTEPVFQQNEVERMSKRKTRHEAKVRQKEEKRDKKEEKGRLKEEKVRLKEEERDKLEEKIRQREEEIEKREEKIRQWEEEIRQREEKIRQREQKSDKKEEKKDKHEMKSMKNELRKLIGDTQNVESRTKRKRSSSPEPARETRRSSATDNNLNLSRVKVPVVSDDEDSAFLVPPQKRLRDKDAKPDPANKRVKITIRVPPSTQPTKTSTPKPKPTAGPKCSKREKSPSPSGPKSLRSGPKISPAEPKSMKRTPSPAPGPIKGAGSTRPGPKSSKKEVGPKWVCDICDSTYQTPKGYASHLRNQHLVRFTPPELSCDACGEWFPDEEGASAHHAAHENKKRPYRCRGCKRRFLTYDAYKGHSSKEECVPWTEVEDVKCADCSEQFPTQTLLDQHKCEGKPAQPAGECYKCHRSFQSTKGLKLHLSKCNKSKKMLDITAALKVDPKVRRRLKPAQVRVSRCDALLQGGQRKRCSVAGVDVNFGFDPAYRYPYRSWLKVKREPLAFDGMVSINQNIRDEFYVEEDYVHWDSDNSSTDDEQYQLTKPTEKKKKVLSLTALSLKTLFSKRCIGKVPRKLRKVRPEKFDTFFNPELDDNSQADINNDINNIINNLSEDNESDSMIGGFSMSDIKLSDIKSISETESLNIMKNYDEKNNDSDSLFGDEHENVAERDKVDFDSVRNGENLNKEKFNFDLEDTKRVTENDSETDASVDDNIPESQTKQIIDDKDTASENSIGFDTTTDTNNATSNSKIQDEKEITSESQDLDNSAASNTNMHDDRETASENGHVSVINTDTNAKSNSEILDGKDTASENSIGFDTTTDTNNATSNSKIQDEKEIVSESQDLDDNAASNTNMHDDRETASDNGHVSVMNTDTNAKSNSEIHEEKDPASESCQDIDNNTTRKTNNLQNGENMNSVEQDKEKTNGDLEKQPSLIDELGDLYDKKLMDELDAQIRENSGINSEKNNKMSLEDLELNKNNCSLSLDGISDEEFNFDD